MTQYTDAQEGYADGIAGRDAQARAGSYLAGYAQATVDRVALLLRQLANALCPPAQPAAHKLLEDE